MSVSKGINKIMKASLPTKILSKSGLAFELIATDDRNISKFDRLFTRL
jgi:hypothetical protein